ncbi:MAG: class I SAM-dependent methyltransferase [Candidatus Freyarchaeum deiterrae]
MVSMNVFQKFFVNRFNRRRVPKRVISLLDKAGIAISGTFLEVGAGLGYTSYAIFDKFHPKRVVISDFDPRQIQAGQKLAEKKYGTIPPELEFRQEDALHLSFESKSFDFVLSTLMFHHLEDRGWEFKKTPQAIQEIQRILRPHGTLIFWDIFVHKQMDDLFLQAGYTILYKTTRQRIYQHSL